MALTDSSKDKPSRDMSFTVIWASGMAMDADSAPSDEADGCEESERQDFTLRITIRIISRTAIKSPPLTRSCCSLRLFQEGEFRLEERWDVFLRDDCELMVFSRLSV